MRNTVAKKLRRAAATYAAASPKHQKNVVQEVKHQPKLVQFGWLPELDSLGRLQPRLVEVVPVTVVNLRGPRRIYRRLKRLYRSTGLNVDWFTGQAGGFSLAT